MTRSKLILGLVAGILISSVVAAQPVIAAEFSSSSLMFQHNKVSQSNVQILVVVQPSSATTGRTETALDVQFASGFSVNGSASAIQVSTLGIPTTYQGHTLVSMPGMVGVASSVSGQTARFAIGNLSAGIYYAFYITNGIDTASSVGKYVHIISTIDGLGIVETRKIGSNIVTNDQIGVSAAVQPNATSGTLGLSGSPITSTVLQRGDEATITLTYSHSLPSSQPMQIVASWDRGYLSGSPLSKVDAVAYKIGSATDTDTSIPPIVDLTNRTITWAIPSVTSNVSHVVSYVLKVSSTLTSITPEVVQDIQVNGSILGVALAPSSISYNINFYVNSASATQTPSPTLTSAPGSTLTPTPVPAKKSAELREPFSITSVAMRAVTKDSVRMVLTISEPSTYTIFYGLRPSQLTEVLTGISSASQHSVEMGNLNPATQYYFKIVAKNTRNKQAVSDIFTFTTATEDQAFNIAYGTVLWEQLPLAHIINKPIGGIGTNFNEIQHIFAPPSRPLTFTFKFDRPKNISSVILRIQDSKVLGISTYIPALHLTETKLLESVPGYFTGQLNVPSETGNYRVYLEIADTSQGVQTQELPYQVFVSRPIRVLDGEKGVPIEGAVVTIYIHEAYKEVFTLLESIISFNSETNELGELDLILPEGRYRFEVDAPGYEKVHKDILINVGNTEYPEFKLHPSLKIEAMFDKQLSSLNNVLHYFEQNLGDLNTSPQVKRSLRDVGLLFSFILFILVEYARMYVGKLKHHAECSLFIWTSMQLINVIVGMGVILYVSLVLAMLLLNGFSSMYILVAIAGILGTLWYLCMYYMWKILVR